MKGDTARGGRVVGEGASEGHDGRFSSIKGKVTDIEKRRVEVW